MKIQIAGMGCAKCNALYKEVQSVVNELGLDATVEKLENMEEFITRGIFSTPALLVNGKQVLSGRLPSREELKNLLQ